MHLDWEYMVEQDSQNTEQISCTEQLSCPSQCHPLGWKWVSGWVGPYSIPAMKSITSHYVLTPDITHEMAQFLATSPGFTLWGEISGCSAVRAPPSVYDKREAAKLGCLQVEDHRRRLLPVWHMGKDIHTLLQIGMYHIFIPVVFSLKDACAALARGLMGDWQIGERCMACIFTPRMMESV